MRLRSSLTLLAAVLLLPGVALPETVEKERERLQGTWVAVSAERNGAPADHIQGHRLVITGATFTIQHKKKILYQGTFLLGPDKKPKELDMTHNRAPLKGKVWLGIYRLEKDALTICDNAANPQKDRPSAFATTPGSGHVLIQFERTGR
jgi:uncharacterized protein (TIGR03067 family)